LYLAVLARRKFVILPAIVLVPVLAVFFSLRQQKLYSANAKVLLNRTNLAAMLNGVNDPNAFQAPDRAAATQASLARVPEVARRAVALAGVHGSATDFLHHSSVSTQTNSDLLQFSVNDPSPARAQRLATDYAQAFTAYKADLDNQALNAAQADVAERLATLRAQQQRGSPLYQRLSIKQQELVAAQALETTNALVVQRADSAQKIRPRPLRDGAAGLGLGIALALALAFLIEALDTRVSSVQEIEERLKLPLLARVPVASGGSRGQEPLVTLTNPNDPQAEAFRVLKTSLDFASLGHDVQSIVITSGLENEGKSTTIANLGVTLVQSGRSVLLCDLDARRSTLGRIFGLLGRPGITDVALGRARLLDAIAQVPLSAPVSKEGNGRSPTHANGSAGVLEVLPFGDTVPPNPGEFIASPAIADLLDELKRDAADLVLIDVPPLLAFGDAMAISARADAIIVVTRVNATRRPVLDDLARILSASPARPLGFVAIGAPGLGRYDLGGYAGYRSEPAAPTSSETVTHSAPRKGRRVHS
jgi:Mrp family chromosome partitioning ATPase/capsular polysaccharide biosynthesis protein